MAKKFKAREDVVFTDLDDGSAVLLHLESKYYYSLNDTGCFLWKLIESGPGVSEDKMLNELVSAFEVEQKQAKSDIKDFIRDLTAQGLIE